MEYSEVVPCQYGHVMYNMADNEVVRSEEKDTMAF